MHLFLYQAARHQTTGWNNRYRYKQNTKRGDFDLELLKRGIKNRYSIICHGEHEFQQALDQVGLGEELYGHLVEIPEVKNAVWFKLNYDQVGKGQTKYVGSWRELKAADIQEYVDEYKLLKQSHSRAQTINSSILSQLRNVNDFAQRHLTNGHLAFDATRPVAAQYIDELRKSSLVFEAEIASMAKKMAQAQKKIRDYMAAKKF